MTHKKQEHGKAITGLRKESEIITTAFMEMFVSNLKVFNSFGRS
jgi:hypothetical protein